MKDLDADEFDGSEIAVCAMAGRFPGAGDVSAFWKNLCDGVESIATFSSDEVLAAGEDPELAGDPHYVRARGMVAGADLFDAAFFGLAPREAEILDPQQRLFLECAWEALEQAGYDPQRFPGAIGLVAGATASTYLAHQLYRNRPAMKAFGDVETAIYNSPGTTATLTAYKLNLKGPCCSVQTFCSTSLVAVHVACQSLLNYESDIALAGGVTIHAPQERGYLYQEGGIVSPDGRCRVFDAEAAGTVFGNGVGVVVLRRLKDALADRDTVRAIIRGSAVNNDGSLKVSYTAPSVVGQTEVIVEALGAAGVHPETIGYVEAHGTGTRLGDPVELEALTKAFRTKTNRTGFCAIGSVKSNVGHLDAAAGVTGLIKAILCLEQERIPATLHCGALNPLIDFRNSPFVVNTALTEWARRGRPRRAAVSAFGIGGTNAHAVLEEAPPPAPDDRSRPHQLLLLSAKTAAALESASRRLSESLRSNPRVNLADVAYTLQVGRREFAYRRALVTKSAAAAANRLEGGDDPRMPTVRQDKRNPPVVFVFPGARDARVDMARGLYDEDAAFKQELDTVAASVRRHIECDVFPALYPSGMSGASEPRVFADPFIGQVASFAVEYALARLWTSWGIRPDAVVGCDVGEVVAGCVAGVLTIEDGLTLLARENRRTSGRGAVPLHPGAPTTRLVSGTTGETVSPEEMARADWWGTCPLSGARFDEAVQSLAVDSTILLQLGPGYGPPPVHGLPTLAAPPDERHDVECVLGALGRVWLAGVEIDWAGFYGSERRRRIPLPTYPFERQRFWVDIEQVDEPEPPAPAPGQDLPSIEKDPDIARWFYLPEWRQTPPPRYYSGGRAVPDGANWLVLLDSSPLGTRITERLKCRVGAERMVAVTPGTRFERTGPFSYTLDPGSPRDYLELFDDLDRTGRLPEAVAHLWESSDAGESGDAAAAEAAQQRGFYSLIWLAQAMRAHEQAEASRRVTMKIVTSGVQEITGTERLRPERATLLGPCQVIAREHPGIRCSHVDVAVDTNLESDELDGLADQVVQELVAETPETTVAYRGGRRWSPVYERVALEREAPHRVSLREAGVYLITGGLGAIGSVLSRHLAKTVRARLVLVSRSALPPPGEWDRWLASHRQDATSGRIRHIRALETAGAEVLVVAADVADRQQMEKVVAQAVSRFGRIDGVIAAAGAAGAGAIQQKKREATASVLLAIDRIAAGDSDHQFRAKLRGLFVLEDVLADRPLDFCMIVSSLSSMLAGPGYATYAAANIFMDAFVRRHNRHHRVRWLSANWDAWSFENPGSGAALSSVTITESEGVDAFERLLGAADLGQVIVSTANLYARFAALAAPPQEKAGRPGVSADLPRYARPTTLEADFEAPRTPLERTIAEVWERVLGIDRVGRRDSFFELGGHSLLAVQVAARLEDALEIEVPMRHVFDAATVADLADRIELALVTVRGGDGVEDGADVEELEI